MSLKELRKKLHGKTKNQLIRLILVIWTISPKAIKHRIENMVHVNKSRSTTRKSKRKSKKAKHRKTKRKSKKHSGKKRSKLSIKRERIRNLNKGRKRAGLKAIPIPRR